MNTSPEIQKPKRPRRWLKRLVWSFAWLITLLILAVVVLNWKGARAWKAVVEEMNAKGESLDIASIVPPPVPDEDNMAMAPIFAQLFEPAPVNPKPEGAWPLLRFLEVRASEVTQQNSPKFMPWWRGGQFTDLESWQTCYWGHAEVIKADTKKAPPMSDTWKEHFKKDYWKGEKQTPAQDVLFALRVFDVELEQVREACERPYSRFPHQYEKGVPAQFEHFKAMQNVARIVSLKSSAELANQNPTAALDDVFVSLRMAEAAGSDPTLISYLVGNSILPLTYQPIWEGIVTQKWNDIQLSKLETKLSSINLVKSLQTAIRGDQNLAFIQLDSNQRNTEFFKSWFGMQEGPHPAKWLIPLVSVIPQGWFDYNKVWMVRSNSQMLGCLDVNSMRVFPERVSALNPEAQQSSQSRFRVNFMLPGLQFSLIHQVSIKCAFNQDVIGLARIAIALERHFLKHGSYPENLAGLDEAFSLKGGIPHDVATGNPPRYSRTSTDRFVLYYDGWNGKDDGGITHMESGKVSRDFDHGDWVWPMPAEKQN